MGGDDDEDRQLMATLEGGAANRGLLMEKFLNNVPFHWVSRVRAACLPYWQFCITKVERSAKAAVGLCGPRWQLDAKNLEIIDQRPSNSGAD
jgi:hypothetical protein